MTGTPGTSALRSIDITLVRRMVLFVVLVAAVVFVAVSARWSIMWDTQVMHYVDFLIAHGRAPYREIGDMNMPGAYLFEHFGIMLFGGSDLAWRMYEFFLLALCTGGMVLIAKPYDWVAGVIAGVLFALFHGIDLADNAVQRDEIMTVLMVLAYAAVFGSVRRHLPVLAFIAGLLFGMAASIKPTALVLALAMMGATGYILRRRNEPWLKYLFSFAGGLVLLGLAVVGYLLRYHAVKQFAFILLKVIPGYAPMGQVSNRLLLGSLVNHVVFEILFLAILAAFALYREKRGAFGVEQQARWEQLCIWIGIAFGVLSYLMQHKGYPYHRYPATAFALLWSCIVLLRGIRGRWLAAGSSLAAMALITMFGVPLALGSIIRAPAHDLFAESLEKDLREIGPAQLQYQVQCLDVVYGCMNALYHDDIVQYSGSTGDLLYFQPTGTPIVEHYRDEFWKKLQRSPPEVFVVSNQWFGGLQTFRKVQAWPMFADYLSANYVQVVERGFHETRETDSTPGGALDHAYRIYVRRNSPLLPAALLLHP